MIENHGNDGLAIDLGGDGVTPNDNLKLDADDGDNGLQNFPTVTRANHVTKVIKGRLKSTPNTSFTIEVFMSAACDKSHYGEGRTFLGSTVVTTGAAGRATFKVVTSKSVAAGSAITATATDPALSTSEFSKCFSAN